MLVLSIQQNLDAFSRKILAQSCHRILLDMF